MAWQPAHSLPLVAATLSVHCRRQRPPSEWQLANVPVGMQVVAPHLEDRTAIHFARLIEEVIGGFEAPPGYAD